MKECQYLYPNWFEKSINDIWDTAFENNNKDVLRRIKHAAVLMETPYNTVAKRILSSS